MPSCVINSCKNNSCFQKKAFGLTFHKFPGDKTWKEKWIKMIRDTRNDGKWLPSKFSVVCSSHFEEDEMYYTKGGYCRIKKNATPKKIHLVNSEWCQGAEASSSSINPKSSTLELNIENEESDGSLAEEENEIKVFCPKCNAEISHTAKGIQEDKTKILIAKVYHYFEQEYEELKKSIPGLELTPLSKFRQRTALATGVSETAVDEILQEEARRQQQEEATRNESHARKRPRQTYSSSEEDSDNDDDVTKPFDAVYEQETLVVKEEPDEEPSESYNEPEILLAEVKTEPGANNEPEILLAEVKTEPGVSGANDAQADPISTEFKTEPHEEEATTSNVQTAVKSDAKRRTCVARKRKRNIVGPSDVSAPPAISAPPPASAAPAASTPPAASAPPTADAPPGPPRRQLLLLDDGDIKMEQLDIEEGFS